MDDSPLRPSVKSVSLCILTQFRRLGRPAQDCSLTTLSTTGSVSIAVGSGAGVAGAGATRRGAAGRAARRFAGADFLTRAALAALRFWEYLRPRGGRRFLVRAALCRIRNPVPTPRHSAARDSTTTGRRGPSERTSDAATPEDSETVVAVGIDGRARARAPPGTGLPKPGVPTKKARMSTRRHRASSS